MPSLTPDCRACTGLCCVATSFRRSRQFAVDKPYGRPCRNLLADYGCRVHDELRDVGFAGCAVFDCLGAGQRTTAMFGGRTWRSDPDLAGLVFDVFFFQREFHTMLWNLDQALRLPASAGLHEELRREIDRVVAVGDQPPEMLSGADVDACADEVDALVRRASALVRAHLPLRRDLSGANLSGVDLTGADLVGADLSAAVLIDARLSGADLRWADLRGAQLESTDLRGADLSGALFVHQGQLEAAGGDVSTRLPVGADRPAHWS